jgi:hypothetical protein
MLGAVKRRLGTDLRNRGLSTGRFRRARRQSLRALMLGAVKRRLGTDLRNRGLSTGRFRRARRQSLRALMLGAVKRRLGTDLWNPACRPVGSDGPAGKACAP